MDSPRLSLLIEIQNITKVLLLRGPVHHFRSVARTTFNDAVAAVIISVHITRTHNQFVHFAREHESYENYSKKSCKFAPLAVNDVLWCADIVYVLSSHDWNFWNSNANGRSAPYV